MKELTSYFEYGLTALDIIKFIRVEKTKIIEDFAITLPKK